MKPPKRIRPHFILTAHREPAAGKKVYAVDANWLLRNGRPRAGRNFMHPGGWPLWRWGEPTHWAPYLR